jgi:DNA-binding SARP family transcriptional activator
VANGVRFPLAKPRQLDFDGLLWWRDTPNAESHQADQEPLSQRLRIDTFGHFAVRYGGRDVVLNGRKARALLGYLALAESGQETRERLVGLLWSETEEAKARASLRQTLYEIREAFQAVGFDKFDADKHVTRIDRDALEVDLWDVMGGAKRGEPHAILLDRDRATEGLLNELESVDPAFRSWLMAKRQSLHDRLVQHLEDAFHGQTDAAASAGQERVARALMKLDPTHEEAARALIRVRLAAGDMGGALGIYKSLWKLLEDEYDVEPSKETQELIAAAKLGQPDPSQPAAARAEHSTAGAAAATQPPAAAARKSADKAKLVVAVAGFDAIGTREQNRYLVQGFRRELIASLVRFREWVVRDQGHVAAGALPSSSNFGEYIIDASATESSGSLRLVLMLRDAETNDYLWSERFQISMENWFEVQQAIVRRLATALNVHVSAGRLAALALKQDEGSDLLAFDLWLQGQTLLLNHNPADWQRGSELIREVIKRMPSYSPAYCGLANAHNMMHISLPGIFRDAARAAQALEYAREAVRLDPVNSRAQLCLGWSHAMSRRTDEAQIHAGLAYELNENDPWTRVSAAHCLSLMGAHEQARELTQRLVRDEPVMSPKQWSFHAITCFMESDYEGCLAAAERAEDSYHVMEAWKAAALVQLRRRVEAKAQMPRFFEQIRARWNGKEPASDPAIARWFLHVHPIHLKGDWERLRDGLAAAGMPVAGLAHGVW